ncbi:hypothetical protein ACF0H5_011560 [Mactra antiquata]
MSEETQDVAFSVVPSLLPSCSPTLSSEAHGTQRPEISDPYIDESEPKTESEPNINVLREVIDDANEPVIAESVVNKHSTLLIEAIGSSSDCLSNSNAKCGVHFDTEETNKESDTLLKSCGDNNCEPGIKIKDDENVKHRENVDENKTKYEETEVDDTHHDKTGYSINTVTLNNAIRNVHSGSSTSTDGTLRNSDESCESDVHPYNSDICISKSNETSKLAMGNKQSGGKQDRENNDGDGRTKCCEIPKRKDKKDRNSRSSRSSRTSRHDDLGFDADEVYPFDRRAINEHEINEPVELEPFEIVETDDIKFVPGAGTSDVIKSVSEPKFSTIPEETLHAMEFASATEEPLDTLVKVPFYIEKGNKLVEPGTSTAHSTFEFKHVKPKTKLVKITPDPFDHNYENVHLSCDAEAGTSGINFERKTSNSSSNSAPSSKNLSRNNSKDAKQKPARKGKPKTTDNTASPNSASSKVEAPSTSGADVKRKKTKGKKEQAIRDSEIDRKIDSVLMLTQTMFSQTKPSDKSEEQANDQQQNAPAIKYENVGVVAKMESTGIKIVHKEVPIKMSKESCENKSKPVTQCIDGKHCEQHDLPNTAAENTNKTYPQLSSDIMEISESGTLIIKSLADLPSEKPDMDDNEPESSISGDQTDQESTDQTDCKTIYATIDNEYDKEDLKVSCQNKNKGDDETEIKMSTDSTSRLTVGRDNDVSKSPTNLEEVPPPSPTAMDALAEIDEEEEDEDYDEDDAYNEDKRKSAEIAEFTENVCKRLSQLLILEEHKEEEEDDIDTNDNNIPDEQKFADHIYETIDSNYRIVDDVAVNKQGEYNNKIDSLPKCDGLTLSTRSESTGTLKRISGDSETHQLRDSKESMSSESSDDDMPSYFDPSQDSLRNNDTESSVTNSCANTTIRIDEVAEHKLSQIKSNASNLDFTGGGYDNVILENEDNVVSEPLKTFDLDLMNMSPSSNRTEDLLDTTPTAEAHPNLTALTELANVEVETPLQYDTSGRHSVTYTESDLDISEHRDDLSTDSMLADDEAEETMEILFTKTYTEPVEGAEVFLSCTVVNSAYKDEQKKSETWLSDEALEYFEANASEVMSTAFLKAKKEMKDIQICLQSLRQQMEHFHSDCDDVSLPEIPVDSLSPDYFGIPHRKAITD